MQGVKHIPQIEIIDAKPTCKVCNKLGVCGVFQAIAPLMGNWKGEQKPFEVESLATICRYYARQYEENL